MSHKSNLPVSHLPACELPCPALNLTTLTDLLNHQPSIPSSRSSYLSINLNHPL